MPGVPPEWSADDYAESDQEFERSPLFSADAVAHARQALQKSGYEPQTDEERALHAKLNPNR